MNGRSRTKSILILGVACLGGGLWLGLARAELADIFLKDGRRLRGDVTQTETEIVVRNAAGETRYKKADVDKIVPVPAGGKPESRPAGPGDGPASQPGKEPEGGTKKGLPVPPPMSDQDILRMKLSEFPLKGEVDRVRIRLLDKPGQPDLPALVAKELEGNENFDEAARERLRRGSILEKLQTILRLTGLKHIDRIQIDGDPPAFDTFRHKILPLVRRGCAAAGCHGGASAVGLRFPTGTPQNETYVYTTFAILDRLETRHGPLLVRDQPEASMLLRYMLPAADNDKPHPTVRGNARISPVLRGTNDREYKLITDWIRSMRVPRPDYELEYPFPTWVRLPNDPGLAEKTAEPAETETGDANKTPPSPDKEPRKKDPRKP